ncbi:LOW QUALITY PROTEIN: imaginal disc development protein B4 [Aphomia sociella]
MFRTASVEGSGPRTPPAYAPHPHVPPRFFPPRIRPPPQYCFDAARFACDASKPRYLDVERERLVTRWLAEANEALVRRDRPPRYKPRSSERRPDFMPSDLQRRPNAPEWADNFLLGRRNGSVEPEDDSDVMTLKEFVDKFSLPRVVKFEGEDRPVLLYRVLEAHRRVEAVPLSGKKGKLVGKPLYIPDSYDGWFSACGCRGGALASPRGSIAALLRARAFALVSPRAISAYRARPASESGRVGAQYERAAARPGTPLRLAGVFADGSKAKAPKYAQLIDPQGNELFVPINTKGEMFEVCPEELSPAEWEGNEPTSNPPPEAGARAHRLPHLLSLWRLPTRVRLLAGTVPIEMAHDVGDDLLLRAAVTEPVLVMCTLPEYSSMPSSPSKQVDPRYHAKECLRLLPLNSTIKVRRTQLGFENEKRMFLSARLQKALTFCQLNVDNWIRQISYANSTVVSKAKTAEDLIREDHEPVKFEKERKFTLQGLKIDTSRLFGKSEKVLKDIPDETEGSIIFLSKNELEHMNYDVYSDDEGKDDKPEDKMEQEQFSSDKMHVFREDSAQKKNKWFKNLKLLKSTEKLTDEKITAIEKNEKLADVKDPFDPLGEKHSSIERYQDMAKLIEDRFGATRKHDGTAEKSYSYKSLTTSSSDMGTSQCSSNHKKPVLTKSVSVQTGMPDSSYNTEEDSGISMKHGRKNLSVDQINYCGSMESDTSSGRKLKSLDENMLKKSSATKSSTNLERRQRIQPDLIPEKAMAKSESYNQIQSCEEINMFGVGSLYNDSDFEINSKQHSFITEKLCSEFHVKTKRVLSKSTSNLLHPKKSNEKKEGSNSNSMPTKTERSNDVDKLVNFRKKIDKPRAPTPKSEIDDEITTVDISEEEPQTQVKIRRSISSIQKRKLPVIEDLPYGQVADAVQIEEEKVESDASSDNIYAEICTPNGNKPSDEDNYDNNIDVLANDPVICNVKKEVIIRNDERARQMIENQENPFRHIEVVVIEKTTDFDLDNSSITSSDLDDMGSKNDVSIAVDSWERDKVNHTDQKIHAIRLEITSNMDDYPNENESQSLERTEVRLSKDNCLSFSNSIHLNGTYPNEAIYDTLK